MHKRILQKYFLILPLCIFKFGFSQSNHIYYHKNPMIVEYGKSIEISQLLFQNEDNKFLYFFRDGELSYQEVEMTFEGGKWIGFIPGDRVTVLGLEYVTILTKLDGGKIALPLIDNPFNNPLSIRV